MQALNLSTLPLLPFKINILFDSNHFDDPCLDTVEQQKSERASHGYRRNKIEEKKDLTL